MLIAVLLAGTVGSFAASLLLPQRLVAVRPSAGRVRVALVLTSVACVLGLVTVAAFSVN